MRAICPDKIAFHAIGVRAVGCGKASRPITTPPSVLPDITLPGVSATISSTDSITGRPVGDQDAQFAIADRLRAGGIEANGITEDDVSDGSGVQ